MRAGFSSRSIAGSFQIRRLALCGTVLAALAGPLAAEARDTAAVISIGEPAGFANLTERQTLLVDVYFGGVRKGEARIAATPGAVTLLEPVATLDLLPRLADRRTVEAALAAEALPANASLACTRTVDPSQCGRLEPDVAGVIFDRDRFRLDIFVNPRFLAVRDDDGELYLPQPQDRLAMIHSIGAVASGTLGSGADYHNVQDSLIVASGDRRLRADLFHADQLGFGAERIVFEWDRPGLRYSAGALWVPGNAIRGRRKLVGAGFETQIDTRRDKDAIAGSPVVVYLDQRARVDLIRDGRVLYSAVYEAGNRQIDTSSLPDGSYDIVLRIEEPGRPPREERRFFTKSRRVPSQGRTDFYVFGGLLVDDHARGSLNPSDEPYVQAGIAHRLAEGWAIDGSVAAADDATSAELGVTFLSPLVQIRAAAIGDLDGMYGGILQLASSGTSRLNFNFDLRLIEADAASDPLGAPALAGPVGSYAQIGGIVSYSLAGLRLLGTLSYRDDEAQRARYSIGPAVEWDVVRQGPFTVTLRGDMTVTERGNAGFAGVALRLLGGRSAFAALGGARASGMTGDDLGEGAVAALSGSWNPQVAGGELALGAGFEHRPREDSLVVSSDFRHPLGSLSGDFVRNEGPAARGSQYSLGFQTTLAAGAGAVRVAGRTTTESVVVARIDGARPHDTFELLVDERVVGTITGSGPFAAPLPAYRAYRVRIRPAGETLLAYDGSSREIGLFPGTVARLEWTVSPVTIKFGRLTSPDGQPVRHASITGKGVWSETDDEGYFQIEAPDDASLEVTLPDGRTFATMLPAGEPRGGIARIGTVVCCAVPDVRFGALDPLIGPFTGGSQ